ncbi:cytochrome P450 4F3-like [Saccoglossus kowalevskii]|uniref:Leukotriene-B(4) omega-hydroxylase 2-like n=1 Tax=Saccoglossus kowalevskii TaxID=10224 RepID=A0ABM0LVM0_SACKO|nr:PREDICTED: leukotriene-B(4) omega-hydroxylase 2-like [Saccoglossus kowalevskii]
MSDQLKYLMSWKDSTVMAVHQYASVVWVTICVVLVLNTLLRLAQLMRKRRRAERDLALFPSPMRHWFFGHLLLMKNNEQSFLLLESFTKHHSTSRVSWTGPFEVTVILYHPSVIKPLLASTEPKDDLFYGFLRPWLGDGLLLSRGKKWFRNRKLLTPGFHFDILKPYVQVFNECANKMLDNWSGIYKSSGNSDGVTMEMFEHISLMTLDSLLRCIFSQESNCQMHRTHPYIQAVYALSYLVVERGRFPPFYSDFIYALTPSGYRHRQALKVLHGHTNAVIKERRETLKSEEAPGIGGKEKKFIDFLDILLKAKDADGHGLTDKEIQDEVDTFMFEGHDTTASGISWCLYNLAKYKEHQDRCREEVNDLLTIKDRTNIEWEDLGKLPYLTMTLKESLRLHPPVPMTGRMLTKPLVLPDGRTIPPGYRVTVNADCLHRNQHVWKDPLVFDPLRFTPENKKTRSPHAYIPFSAGPRNCIGQNFALNEMKVTIATILNRFELDVDESQPPNRTMRLVLRSINGIHLRVKPLTK